VSDFSLRRLVREVLDTSTMSDPHALADEVLRRIGNDDLRAALGQVLASMVREEIRSSRNGGLPVSLSSPSTPRTSHLTLHKHPVPRQTMEEQPGAFASPRLTQSAKRARSAKVAAIRDAAPKWLRDRLNTGGDPREWKRVGDCTFSDLMFAAAQRREQAARTSAAAERLEALAELLRAHKVELVRDLPQSVLVEMGGAAA
jgi:hypothetical protein